MLPSRTKRFKRDYAAILAKYPANTPVRVIERAESIPRNTLWRNIKLHQLRPVKQRSRKMWGSRRVMLNVLLDHVNALRQQDLTGPEACGVITDIILDALDALGG